jgi:hypothetical protein
MQFAVLHRSFPASPLVSSDNEGCFPWSKADHLTSLYCLGPLTPHAYMVQCLIKHRHKLTLTFYITCFSKMFQEEKHLLHFPF